MTITYPRQFVGIRTSKTPINGCDDVVVSFEVRVRAEDGETEGHADWFAGVRFSDAHLTSHVDPAGFLTFPTDPADTPAFEDALWSWALDHLDMTEAQIEASALARLEAHKARPIPKTLP